MEFPDAKAGESAKLKLSFKHYQRIEGQISLPEGASVKNVQMTVLEKGELRAKQGQFIGITAIFGCICFPSRESHVLPIFLFKHCHNSKRIEEQACLNKNKSTIDSLIGGTTNIEGDIHFKGGLRIDGRKGQCDS